MKLRLVATAVFGMEAIVADEIKKMGYENIVTENGRVLFDSDIEGMVRANLWLRTPERIFILMGSFKAKTFVSLFDQINAMPWEAYIPKDAAFPVDAKSVKSTLFSLSDIQSITKKAIVNRLKKLYKTEWFSEDKETYKILVAILKDEVSVMIDTSGSGLHRRGYRERGNEAPMKETLAAGLLKITNWKPGMPLIDPCCGSGTIAIEAAMIARNIAPGLNRKFAFENFRWVSEDIVKALRKEAYEAINHNLEDPYIQGYDIDARSIAIARENAELAGVEDLIHFQVRDLKDFSTQIPYGHIIINPPYGERLEEKEEVEKLYKLMGKVFAKYPRWSKYIITSYENFESAYGSKATKNRKLYNGRIKTYFYQYYGERPPKQKG